MLAALAGALFGGLVTGVTAQIVLAPLADVPSWPLYLGVWLLGVLLGSLLGALVLQAALDRFDYGISFHAAAAALFAGQIEALVHVWLPLMGLFSLGVTSLVASAVVVWVVMFTVQRRTVVEPR